MDPESEERFAALEARMRGLESAADDPWSGPPISLGPPGPKPVSSGPQLFPDSEPEFWGEIVSEVGSGVYTFKQKCRADATTWKDRAGGRTGTCYEANDVEGIAVGTIIRIRLEHDTSGTLRYVFDASSVIPAGTADHDILIWDQTTDKAWEVRAFAGSADWDILVWDQTTDKAWEVLAKADADYKVLQRKADDSIGWDWVRAH